MKRRLCLDPVVCLAGLCLVVGAATPWSHARWQDQSAPPASESGVDPEEDGLDEGVQEEPATRGARLTGQPAPSLRGAGDSGDSATSMIMIRLRNGEITLPEGFNEDLLITRGSDGRIIRYDLPLPLVAFEKNPLIGDEQRAALAPVMERRRMIHEINAVNNIDLLIKIDRGEFERLDPRDRRALGWAERIQRLLRPGGMLSEWLHNQGAITAEQAAASQVLGNAYSKALMSEMRERAGDDRHQLALDITRERYRSRVEESMHAYHELVLRSAGIVDECLAAAELPAEVNSSIQDKVQAVKVASTDQEKREAVVALLLAMPDWVMQHRFLDRAVSARYPDRSGQLSGGMVVTPVMAYQVEVSRRRNLEASGQAVPYQAEPPRAR